MPASPSDGDAVRFYRFSPGLLHSLISGGCVPYGRVLSSSSLF